MLRPFGLEHIHTFGCVRQSDAADMMQAAGHSCQRFELAVKLDRVTLQGGHVGIAIQGVKTACRMPGGSGSELGSLQQDHIRPAEFGEVVQNRTTHDAAADHTHLCVRFHLDSPCDLFCLRAL